MKSWSNRELGESGVRNYDKSMKKWVVNHLNDAEEHHVKMYWIYWTIAASSEWWKDEKVETSRKTVLLPEAWLRRGGEGYG